MCSTNFEGGDFGHVFSHGEIEEVEEIGELGKIGDMILGALFHGFGELVSLEKDSLTQVVA
jgi:hypothetical protein